MQTNENDVIVRCAVNVKRNYADVPFCSRMNNEDNSEMVERMKKTLEKVYSGVELRTTDLNPEETRISLPRMIDECAFRMKGEEDIGSCLLGLGKRIHVTVCRSDHINITAFFDDAYLSEAYDSCRRVENALMSGGEFAFDGNWGYLSALPSYTGNGVTGTLVLHLFGLNRLEHIEELEKELKEKGIELRNLQDSEDGDCEMFCLTGSIQLGKPARAVLESLLEEAHRIVEKERQSREELIYDDTDSYADDTMRAMGILLNARLIRYPELLELYSDVRAGLTGGLLQGDLFELDRFICEMSDSEIASNYQEVSARDIELIRADTVRRKIGEMIKSKKF